MEELLELLRDGHARTLEGLAMELHTDTEDIGRKLEYLEMTGIIKKVFNSSGSCKTCSGCSGDGASTCKGCMPEGGFQNMGQMWEVV